MQLSDEYIKELLERQKLKPIEEKVNWSYTLHPGDVWKPINYPVSKSAIKRMENEVKNIFNWGKNPNLKYPNFTIIRIVPPFSSIHVHLLKFPDGRIWNSRIRKFQNIK